MPGASGSQSLSRQHAEGREVEQNLCSNREIDSLDLTGKDGGPATTSGHLLADGLLSPSITRGAYPQKITCKITIFS